MVDKLLNQISDTAPRRTHGNLEGLKASIIDIGLINPLTISEDGKLLAGRRRFQAVSELGWEYVPVRILSTKGDRLREFRVAIDENLKRKPLTDPENRTAIAEYDALKRELEGSAERYSHPKAMAHCANDGWTQEKTAHDLGISRRAVGEAIQAEAIVRERPEQVAKSTKQILAEDKRTKAKELREAKEKEAVPIANLILGDARHELEKLDDGIIDCVITDPPYGINYVSNRRKYKNEVTIPIEADATFEEATRLWEDVCRILEKKMATDSHLYVFTSWKVCPVFLAITKQYFIVKNLLIWGKNNWSMGDLEGNYAEQYEMIIFATKGNGKLFGRRDTNVLNFNRVLNRSLICSAEKPLDLLEFLLEKSTVKNELIVDPFAGSGSTLKACKNLNRKWIGIELDEEMYYRCKERMSE